MLATLWTLYLIVYVILTLPFAKFSLVYLGGMILPGILFTFWRMFEAMQAGGEFTVYYKVMGRWYFQLWAFMILPCGVVANFGPEWVGISSITMLMVPTIFWWFMSIWTNTGLMLIDKEQYDFYKSHGRDAWTTEHDLNWDDPSIRR